LDAKAGEKDIWRTAGGNCNGEQMKQHSTSNIQHPTPNGKAVSAGLPFDVQSSMFDVRWCLLRSLSLVTSAATEIDLRERRPGHGAA
jgi:hypothetical protein